MRTCFAILLSLTVLSAVAEKQPYDRYQSIVDRQMFGPLPPGFDPTKLPSEVQKSALSEKELTKEQEQLKSSVHFSVINVTTDGQTQVGFTDNSDPKAPKNYFLKVGESRDGWTVKEADAEKATMVIEKDDIEVSLSLGGNSANNAGATARAGSAGGASPASGSALRRGAAPGGLLGGGTLRSRRQARLLQEQEQKAREAEAAAAREAERQAQAEQEKAQHEAERAEQRQQLLAIQEELKRVREEKTASAEAEKQSEGGDAQDGAE